MLCLFRLFSTDDDMTCPSNGTVVAEFGGREPSALDGDVERLPVCWCKPCQFQGGYFQCVPEGMNL